MNDESVILTTQGRQRQGEILRLAQQAGARRRQRRRLLQAMPVAVMAIAAFLWWRHEPAAVPSLRQIVQTPPAEVQITWIETDTTLADRWAVPPTAGGWTRVTDDQLLDTAAQLGSPLALTQQNGVVRAVSLK